MLKVKPFRQTAGFCGPASLKMVFDYYGLSVSESKIARLAGATRKKGASKEGLVKAAKKLGFKAFFKENSSLNDIRKFVRKKIPVIVDWFWEDDGHYSVVIDIDRKNVKFMDPAIKGIRKIALKKFFRIWFDFSGDYIKNGRQIVLRAMIVVNP